jgi:hypothetical protein
MHSVAAECGPVLAPRKEPAMFIFRLLLEAGMVVCLLAACAPIPAARPPGVGTAPLELAPTETLMPTAATTGTPEPPPLLFSEPGPYAVGLRKFEFTDPARHGRGVTVTVWYPAVRPAGSRSGVWLRDAEPDPREAPYPLILSSTKTASDFSEYVESQFAWASVGKIELSLDESRDDPATLDILFALNQIALNPPTGLEG